MTGTDGVKTIQVQGPLAEISKALAGKENAFKAVYGGNFNSGLGRNSVVLSLQQGTPIQVKFAYSYLFTSHYGFTCSGLIAK